jgi:nitrite reductase/ring-hydroxylating ferredoxin subunit
MLQVSVSDVEDDSSFEYTNKIMLFNINGKYHSTGAFCGFDYSPLSKGVFLNNKIYCPTCGSGYNVENGLVDDGPTMRNLSVFPIMIRKGVITAVLPEQIPPFNQRKMVDYNQLDPRTFVIVGDSETALSAVIALRAGFAGKIVVIPTSPFGAF